ncbi:hypothetical protein [Aeromonas hydrophila]|uniref:hypothetical protein n=1 Tax=Aeromonas hydrophila TaxID=644 RepID=UPI00131A5B45|nr:hypothetical protein [Aeromonas hydrophila]ELA9379482.1 hypothetical protein [Aeromonas hydrophila]
MKHLSTILFSLLFISACDDMPVTTSTGEHTSSSSSTSSSSEREITLSGKSGHAFIGEDELALKDEMVFINGKPFANAPSGSTVRYVVTDDVNSLYVNGKSIPIEN